MRDIYNKHGEEGLKNQGQHGGHGDMFRLIIIIITRYFC